MRQRRRLVQQVGGQRASLVTHSRTQQFQLGCNGRWSSYPPANFIMTQLAFNNPSFKVLPTSPSPPPPAVPAGTGAAVGGGAGAHPRRRSGLLGAADWVCDGAQGNDAGDGRWVTFNLLNINIQISTTSCLTDLAGVVPSQITKYCAIFGGSCWRIYGGGQGKKLPPQKQHPHLPCCSPILHGPAVSRVSALPHPARLALRVRLHGGSGRLGHDAA